MTRSVLPPGNVHSAIAAKVAGYHKQTLQEVQAAVELHPVVVVRMAQNPHCKRARKVLSAANIPFEYLEYGSYLGGWRKRSALKMWTGWPTFPMAFVNKTFVGGANELTALIENGQLKQLLAD